VIFRRRGTPFANANARPAASDAELATLRAQVTRADEDLHASRRSPRRSRSASRATLRVAGGRDVRDWKGERSRTVADRRQALASAELETEACRSRRSRRPKKNSVASKANSRGRRPAPKSSTRCSMAAKELDEGAKAILQRHAKDASFLPGLEGPSRRSLRRRLQGQARAIESALGESAHALVVATAEEALEGIRHLREIASGRGAVPRARWFRGRSIRGGGSATA
jgi:chromosome segregation ATPase